MFHVQSLFIIKYTFFSGLQYKLLCMYLSREQINFTDSIVYQKVKFQETQFLQSCHSLKLMSE